MSEHDTEETPRISGATPIPTSNPFGNAGFVAVRISQLEADIITEALALLPAGQAQADALHAVRALEAEVAEALRLADERLRPDEWQAIYGRNT